MQSSKLQSGIRTFLKPTKGKIFLTFFLLFLMFIISRLACFGVVDPGFYLDPPSPYFDPSPRLRLCKYLYGINWLVAAVILYFIISFVIQVDRGKKVNAK